MAHYLADLSFQEQVDYINYVQQQVAADTLALEKEAVVQLADGEANVPDDLVQLDAVLREGTGLARLSLDEVMAAAGSADGYALVGRRLHVRPRATGPVTLAYYARSGTFTAVSELELSGEAASVFEDLLDATLQFDRGEPEVGMNGIARYEMDVGRIRRTNRDRGGVPHRMRVRGM